ncbi:hypothetical protein D3C84_859370 [compost metagenome]
MQLFHRLEIRHFQQVFAVFHRMADDPALECPDPPGLEERQNRLRQVATQKIRRDVSVPQCGSGLGQAIVLHVKQHCSRRSQGRDRDPADELLDFFLRQVDKFGEFAG